MAREIQVEVIIEGLFMTKDGRIITARRQTIQLCQPLQLATELQVMFLTRLRTEHCTCDCTVVVKKLPCQNEMRSLSLF